MVYPATWGPLFHDVLWFLSLQYPENPSETRQKSMQLLLEHLFANLPCFACTVDASVNLYHKPADVTSKAALQQWLVDSHNTINQKLNKRSDWTVEEALEAFYNRHLQEDNFNATVRAETKRLEDHQHIARLIARLRAVQDINSELSSIIETQNLTGTLQKTSNSPPLHRSRFTSRKHPLYDLFRKYITVQRKL